MPTPIVSILNMKGGVGKTTISAHVFRVLYQRAGIKVLLVDLDPQFNLTQTIVRQKKYDALLGDQKTVMSCFEPLPSNDFFKIKHTDDPPPKAEEILVNLRSFKGKDAKIDLIPGDFDLVKYSLIDNSKALNHAAKYLKRFLSAAKKDYDLIVLDCNPSSSFITKCALSKSTHVLSPVKLDKYSILGVGLVDKLFDWLEIEPKHNILINGVQRYSGMSVIEQQLRSHDKFGSLVLKNRLNTSKYLQASISYTGFATDKGGPYSSELMQNISNISDELTQLLGLGL